MDNLVYATDTSRVKTPGCHGYPAPRLAISGVQLALEQVSSLPWNHCPACRGITVQLAVESVSTLAWECSNFLNGLDLPDFAALNPAVWVWLETVANVRLHRETQRRPVDLWAEERA